MSKDTEFLETNDYLDSILKTLKYISGRLLFLNFMVIILVFANIGVENVKVINEVKTETVKEDVPNLYCSSDNIFYFESTFTVVVDDKNRPKKCSEKNTTYKYDRYYSDYRAK